MVGYTLAKELILRLQNEFRGHKTATYSIRALGVLYLIGEQAF